MAEGHKPVSSEEEFGRVYEAAELAPSSLSALSKIEFVPGYQPRGLADKTLESAAADLAAGDGGAVDAAMASFRMVDTLEVVVGDDDRTVVPDTRQSPWRFNCALRIKAKSGRNFVGTGWFIGPNTVATAGHCVFIHDHGGWAESVEVIPGLDGASRPFDSAVGTRFRSVDGWTEDRDSDFDYGVIILDEPLGRRTGWYGFAALDESRLFSTDANISGYPADRERATRQFFHARKITRASRRKIFYEVDTFGGQSGSPVFLNLENERVAVGIHTTGASTGNSGTLINHDVFNNLRLWKSN